MMPNFCSCERADCDLFRFGQRGGASERQARRVRLSITSLEHEMRPAFSAAARAVLPARLATFFAHFNDLRAALMSAFAKSFCL
jgi:hypothetical protein